MAVETALRLLIIEESANHANAYLKALRSGGFALRSHSLLSDEEPEEILKAHQPDIVLISHSSPLLTLPSLKPLLDGAGNDAATILMCEEAGDISTAAAIEAGARDRVLKSDLDHLKTVVKRELEYVTVKQKHRALEKMYTESESRCQILMNNSRDAISYVHQGMHVYANHAYLEMFGFNGFDDIEGLPIMDLISGEKQEEFKQFLRNMDTQNLKRAELETELKDINNETFPGYMEFSEASIDGEPCTQILIRQSVDTSELEEQINMLSRLDPLTGLLNRLAFVEEFEKALINVSKKNKHYALMHIGIDDFKSIQDKVGLVGSDQVIAEIAGVVKDQLGGEDLAGRYEGSKYLVLIPSANEKELEAKGNKIITAVGSHICEVGGKSINTECRVGISLIDDSSLDVNEVMSRSDKALTEASQEGAQRLHIYQPKEGEMTQKQIDAAWIKRLKSALEQNRLQLRYQPIVQLDGGELERYEVFMEMRNEDGSRVPPNEFLPAAERTKMSKVLDRWVISHAFAQLVKHSAKHPNTVFFIKLTGGSLADTELFRWIGEKLKNQKIQQNRVVFEVKEEAVVSHLKQAQAFATLLKTIQCGFAIDDFGTGPDPFKLVELVPAEYLKFHKDFTQELAQNSQNQKTLKEITEKAKALKKYTIVQHVEDAATLSALWTIGADFTQGNFFQGPSNKMDYDFSLGMG